MCIRDSTNARFCVVSQCCVLIAVSAPCILRPATTSILVNDAVKSDASIVVALAICDTTIPSATESMKIAVNDWKNCSYVTEKSA